MPIRRCVLSIAAALTFAAPLAAQKASPPPAAATAAALVGIWTGTVTVQLGDSAIVAPVTYTFSNGASGMVGTASVPGQGSGTISNVVRTGARVQFRVTVTAAPAAAGATAATPRRLEHDGTLAADGTLDGLVTLDGLPMAKFKVTPKK